MTAGATPRRVIQITVLLLPALAFLFAWFLAPLASFLQLAFESPKGPFHAFRVILESPVYVRVFINSLILATNVMLMCVVLAYPAAYLLSKLKGTLYYIGVYCVLFPLWISVLVRTYSWMLLLERNGPVNRFLQDLGVTDAPVQLMFNDTGVYIGMVHVLLPYALLPIYSSMSRIDGRLLQASDGLGASLLDTFFRVYLPLTMPGVLGGAFFVFLLSLGFFITPALLGGANALTIPMLIESLVNQRLEWSLAAAASILLLGAVIAILAVVARFVPMRAEALKS